MSKHFFTNIDEKTVEILLLFGIERRRIYSSLFALRMENKLKYFWLGALQLY